VVTGSRLEAVRYKQAFDSYIRAKGYGWIKTLVAFSGEVVDADLAGQVFTEVGMNGGIKEAELPEQFDSPSYQVLLVAEKYQTGFDQPLLHTMYVDKRLAGAVHGVGIDGFGEVGADGARCSFLRVGGTHQLAVLGDGVFAFEHLNHDRTGGHEGNQILEERAGLVHSVELAGFLLGQPDHLGGNDLQTVGFETGVNLADNVLGNSVRFDDGEGEFDSHLIAPQKLVS
jgi:hypothetical protein